VTQVALLAYQTDIAVNILVELLAGAESIPKAEVVVEFYIWDYSFHRLWYGNFISLGLGAANRVEVVLAFRRVAVGSS
jgi:hypothetical protein